MSCDGYQAGDGQPGQWHFRKHVRRHFQTAERFVSRVLRLLVPNRRHPERLASPRSSVFLGSVRSLSEAGHLAASLMPRVRRRSEAVDVDRGHRRTGARTVEVLVSVHKCGDKADASDRQARDDPSATYQQLPYGGSWIIAARAVVAGQPSSGAGLVEPAF